MKSDMRSTSRALITAAAVAIATATVARADDQAPRITMPEKVEWSAMIPAMGKKGPAMAVVFGKPGVLGQPFGGLFRVPAGGESPSHIHNSDYWAVMLSGTESARQGAKDAPARIPPGSWWFQPGKAQHVNKCMGPEDCVFFVYYKDGMDYVPAESHTK